MAGLDPAIHPLHEILTSQTLARRLMDTRVKPAYDAVFFWLVLILLTARKNI
jgi:hypothetical protein